MNGVLTLAAKAALLALPFYAFSAGVTNGSESVPKSVLLIERNGLRPNEALARIRVARRAGCRETFHVRFAAGVHTLTEPVELLPGDTNLVFSGESDTVLSGGGTIGPWTDDGNGVWSTPIPKGADGAPIWFEQLWIDGRRALRARHPTKGFFHLASCTNFCVKAAGGPDRWIERVAFTNDEVRSALSSVPAADLGFVHFCLDYRWCYAKRVVRGWDPAAGVLETHFPEPIPSWAPWTPGKGSAVAFENLPAGFDDPGEWLYDARAGRIRYRPLPDEDLSKASVVAPLSKLSQLLVVKGDPDGGRFVSEVRFEGLTFAFADASAACAVTPKGPVEFRQYQAAHSCDAVIMMEGARNVTFSGCTVRQTGNYAFRIEDGCRDCRLSRCRMEDLGAGGVWIGSHEPHIAAGEPLTRRLIVNLAPRSTAFVTVEDCTIRNGGNFNPEGTGVVIGHASDCRVVHNDIGDLLYSGVSVGWDWGYRGSVAQRNTHFVWVMGNGKSLDLGRIRPYWRA